MLHSHNFESSDGHELASTGDGAHLSAALLVDGEIVRYGTEWRKDRRAAILKFAPEIERRFEADAKSRTAVDVYFWNRLLSGDRRYGFHHCSGYRNDGDFYPGTQRSAASRTNPIWIEAACPVSGDDSCVCGDRCNCGSRDNSGYFICASGTICLRDSDVGVNLRQLHISASLQICRRLLCGLLRNDCSRSVLAPRNRSCFELPAYVPNRRGRFFQPDHQLSNRKKHAPELSAVFAGRAAPSNTCGRPRNAGGSFGH